MISLRYFDCAMDDGLTILNNGTNLPPVQVVGASLVETSPSQPEQRGIVCGVYSFVHRETKRRYVGSSKDIYARKKGHIYSAKKGENLCLYRAMRQYGFDAFDFEILEVCEKQQRFEREKYWIKFYNSASINGFNTVKDPSSSDWNQYEVNELISQRISIANTGNKHTPETCAKISEALRKRVRKPETFAKISASLTGKKLSPEHVAKLRFNMLGKKMSPESNKKRSLKMKGKKLSKEHCKKISAARIGMQFSDETKKRLSISHLGFRPSDETRKKLSIAHRKSWRKRKIEDAIKKCQFITI